MPVENLWLLCFFTFKKSFEDSLVEKWVTLEVQGWYKCKKLSNLVC